MDTNETHSEKARFELHKDAACCLEQILEATLHNAAAVRLPVSYQTNHPIKTNVRCTAGEAKANSKVTFLWIPMHGCSSIGKVERSYLHQFRKNTAFNIEYQQGTIDDCDAWFLVWFHGTSTFVGYLMPNQFLYIQTVLFQTMVCGCLGFMAYQLLLII